MTTLAQITRSEVLRRAEQIWPYEGVPYSQDVTHSPDGYRADCSGYLSMCWDLPTGGDGSWGGYSTVTLVTDGIMFPIVANALRPGDAVGLCGPGSGGDNGHVRLFVAWYNDDPRNSQYWCLEQTGGESGPHRRLVDWNGYQAYRFRGILDGQAPAFPLVYPPNYYGNVDGPDESHGGYYPDERPAVGMIQRAVVRDGCVPGVIHPWDGWVDGLYQQPTVDAVKLYQRRHSLTIDGQTGPQTWGDMVARGLLW